jgi:ABC-2 type transport system permease protein
MRKVLRIALREFVAVVGTKAFLIGLLFLPLTVAIVVLLSSFFGNDSFLVNGQVTVIDQTGRVTERLREAQVEGTPAFSLAEAARLAAVQGAGSNDLGDALAFAPQLTILERPASADVDAAKAWLLEAVEGERHLALAVVDADSIEPGAEGYGAYELYVPSDTDVRNEIAVHAALREAITSLRIEARGFDRATIDSLTRIPRVRSVTVTEDAEQQTVSGLNIMVPMAFMFLLFMGVMGGGQGLMTSTIEEKSSRVVEVLLSAVSPMQLMAGKLLGHMSASLVGMTIYLIGGLLVLSTFSLFGLLDPLLIVYLFIFFVITYFVVGSIMMSIGAAVNELSEANSLMMPVMLMLMLPWFLWLPISRDPNSTLSVSASFIPPVNTFAMLLRLASNEPPPAWQVWLTILIGILSVWGAIWFAAKIFRIGLLMHGKPPNFGTMLRWIRDA